jgi:hypothetical protein
LASTTDIMAALRQLASRQTEIRLLNIFKGLPISYGASISSISDSDIHVTSNRYQISCLYHHRETYIQADDLQFTIRSQVMSLNLAREDAVLANFEIAQNSIGNRMNIRVEPGDEPLMGVIQIKGYPNKVTATISDISILGASVLIEDFLFPVRLFQPGNDISLLISFPEAAMQKSKKVYTSQLTNTRSLVRNSLPPAQGGKIDITAWGKLLFVRHEPNLNRYRVSIKFYIKDAERMAVSQYISQRQTEIIRDLRILSDELYNRKK